MFESTRGSGFRITFANGWKISVQFGPGNYSDNRDLSFPQTTPDYTASSNAEVAVIRPNGKFHKMGENDDVIGWQSPADVAAIIAQVSAFERIDA